MRSFLVILYVFYSVLLFGGDTIQVNLSFDKHLNLVPEFVSLEITFSENPAFCNEINMTLDKYSQFELFQQEMKELKGKSNHEVFVIENVITQYNQMTISIYPVVLDDMDIINYAARQAFGENFKLYSWVKIENSKNEKKVILELMEKGERDIEMFKNAFNLKNHKFQNGAFNDYSMAHADSRVGNNKNSKDKTLEYYKFEIANFDSKMIRKQYLVSLRYLIY